MSDLYTFVVQTPENVRDSFLRTMYAGLLRRGVPTPNIGPTSDFYVEGQAVGNEIAPIAANSIIKADAVFIDTATGQDLLDRCALYGNVLQAASGSFGAVILNASSSTTVALGSQLTDSGGLRYQVSVGGTYAPGASIPVASMDPGSATNLAAGTSLQWRTAPAYSAPTALVALGGLINGVDAENQEALRQRTIQKIQNPPGSGNASHCIQVGQAASPSVQFAFCYPGPQGAGTVHNALTAAPTATNSSRQIAAPLMSGTIVPYILGTLAEHAYIVTTTVVDTPVDIAIGLNLPPATTASPPGPGGGWLDGSPWPYMVSGDGYNAAIVTGVTSPTQVTVNTGYAPTPSVSRVCWFNYSTRKLLKATVIAFSGSPSNYTITLDTPFTGIATGDYISPQSANQDLYIQAVLAAYELMGPGEKTSNASALIRAFRHPLPTISAPSALGPALLQAITSSASEVSSAAFMIRNDAVNADLILGPSGVLTPPTSVDTGSIENAPLIYIPKNIAFYPAL